MKQVKKLFAFFPTWEKVFSKLNPEQQGNLIMALFAYVNRGELPGNDDMSVVVAFTAIQTDLDDFLS